MTPKGLARELSFPDLPTYIEAADNLIKELLRSSPSTGEPALRLLKGGKRLRPALVIAAAASRGGNITDKVVAVAAAVELLHMASLVHDDIIDKHTSRRGQPSIYKREGLNQAILTGDWLAAAAVRQAAVISQASAQTLANAFAVLCLGQAQQLNYRPGGNQDAAYFEAVRQKSAVLFRAACQLGGQAANLNKADIAALGKYGEAFGLVFQIIDDVVDGDWPVKSQRSARATANEYAVKAAKSLSGFKGSPTATGLVRLPSLYMKDCLAGQ